MKIIKEQKEEITVQAENLLQKNDEIKLQNEIIQKKNNHITDSINYAHRIQKAVFGLSEIDKNIREEFFVWLQAKDIVSGDFCWIKKVGSKSIFVGADCIGHGVPGAFMSLLGVSFLNEIIQEISSRKKEVIQKDHSKIGIYYEYIEAEEELTVGPGKILERLRIKVKDSLHQSNFDTDTKDGIDLAICILDSEKLELQYAGAHSSLIYLTNRQATVIKADRMPVGIHIKEKAFTQHKIQLQKGDCFYLFSDGMPDQFGFEKNTKFLLKRMLSLFENIQDKPMQAQKEHIEQVFRQWKGARNQIDDVLVLGVRV